MERVLAKFDDIDLFQNMCGGAVQYDLNRRVVDHCHFDFKILHLFANFGSIPVHSFLIQEMKKAGDFIISEIYHSYVCS